MKLGSYDPLTQEAFDARGVSLGIFPDHAAALEAMEAARLPSAFWHPESIPSIPLLQQLNEWVIRQNEKRLPKWKFRFASDFAVQIQPKVTRRYDILFECVAIQTENVATEHFTKPKSLYGLVHWQAGFVLYRDEDEQGEVWWFQPKSTAYGPCPASGLTQLRQRTLDALHPDRFTHLSHDQMLSPHCLCCGKALTDPVSMALWIGPECWGSASNNLPQLFKAEAASSEVLL
jgi:hypothetical protein